MLPLLHRCYLFVSYRLHSSKVRHPQLAVAGVGFNSHLEIWFIATLDASCECEEGFSGGRSSGPQPPQTKCVLERLG